jgi:hypothetical protein
MSDMVARAAKAIADKWLEKVDDSTVRIGPPVIARAALLAALDDVADTRMVTELGLALDRDIAFQIGEPTGFADGHREALARTAIAVLRRLAQGDTVD